MDNQYEQHTAVSTAATTASNGASGVDSINQETSNSAVNKHDITIAEAFLVEKEKKKLLLLVILC